MKAEKQYALATTTKNHVFPCFFKTMENAEEFRQERVDPNQWKIVCREIIYGDWEDCKNN